MTYFIKRLQDGDDYRLIGLQSVESLDDFVRIANKVTRLWIDDRDVCLSIHYKRPRDYLYYFF
jgi:hypothetical protein